MPLVEADLEKKKYRENPQFIKLFVPNKCCSLVYHAFYQSVQALIKRTTNDDAKRTWAASLGSICP